VAFDYSERCKALQEKLLAFMDTYIYPNENTFKAEVHRNGREKGNCWIPTQIIEELKPKAREQGLWNLFLPKSARAPEGLSNLDYTPLCEIMGRVGWAPEVFNCSTLATWKPSGVTARNSRKTRGWNPCCAARSDLPSR
jgi:acyl-CoA dehydrogenase